MKTHSIIMFIFFSVVISAQDYSFRSITSIDGLSQNDVMAIFQDSRGFMWFATYDGLNKYDGYDFEVYRSFPENSKAISSNLIHDMWEDENNHLWVATENSGIFRLDLINDSIISIQNTHEHPNLLLSNRIGRITGYRNGNIWINTQLGLNHIVYSTNGDIDVTQYTVNDAPGSVKINTTPIREFFSIGDTSLWILGHRGISVISLDDSLKQTGEIKTLYHETSRFEDMIQCPGGFIIGSLESLFFLEENDYKQGNYKFHKVADIPTIQLGIANNNDLWAGSTIGVFHLQYTPTTFPPYTYKRLYNTNNSNLSSNVIRHIYKDKTGLIWLGTNGGGVNVLDANKSEFSHYRITNHENQKVKLRAIHQDKVGNIWFGTENNGMFILDAKRQPNYSDGYFNFLPNANSNWHSVFCFADIHTPRGDFVWGGCSYHNLMVELDMDKINTSGFSRVIDGLNHMPFAIIQDSDSIIWIGTYWGGLFRYNPYERNPRFTNFVPGNSKLPSGTIRSLLEDDKKRIWVGTGDGLCILYPNSRKKSLPEFEIYRSDKNNPKSISHNYILPICQAKNGDIWIGTFGGGLNKFIEATGARKAYFINYSSVDGLPNDVIKQILEDDNGNLWVSSNKGLSCINPVSNSIKNYDITDGLQGNEFGELAGCRLHNGEMLFGGINGFNAFYPNEITEDSTIPEIALTRLQISNIDVSINKEINDRVLLKKHLNETDNLKLKYFENSFTIHFTGLHYLSPKKNQYKYILEGFDKQWNNANSKSRVAKYTNLEPGKYIFKVMASNADKVWNLTPKTLQIIIEPPFWKTLFFQVLMVLLVLISLYIIYKLRVRTLQLQLERGREHERVLTIAKTKAEESDNLKSSIIANISHELRTPVNGINGFSELLSQENLNIDKRKRYSTIVRDKCSELIKLLDSILEISATHTGNIKVEISSYILEDTIKQAHATALHKLGTLQKPIQVLIKESSSNLKQIVQIDHYKILTILNNLIDNAIKFTEAGEVEIGCEIKNDLILYSVRDTGIGISEANNSVIFEEFRQASTGLSRKFEGLGLGLSLCKSYINALGGEIWLDSVENKGTTFYFTIPYLPHS